MTKLYAKKGFTLAELLVVIAIIAVLTAVAIPVFSAQAEKARNAVDIHTAKTVADAVTLYFLAHPEAMKELTEESKINAPNRNSAQITVDGNAAVISPILQPALQEAGLVDSFYKPNYTRDITCKSKDSWGGYRIVFTTWDYVNKKTGDYHIYFWGLEPGVAAHAVNNLIYYNNETDVTGFKTAMGGG